MNIIYHNEYMYNIIYCIILLYIEMKEKQFEDLTSIPERKEGIINTIAITNIVHVTYLSIVIYRL